MTPEERKKKVAQFISGEISGYKLLSPEINPITNIIPKKSVPQEVVEKISKTLDIKENEGIETSKKDISSLGKVTLNLEQTKNNLEKILEVISEDYKNTQEQNRKEAEEYRKRIANRGRIFGKKELGDKKTDIIGGIKKYVGSFFSGAGGAIRGLAMFNLLQGILSGDPSKIIGPLIGIGATYLPVIGAGIGASVAKSVGKRLLGLGGARAVATEAGGVARGAGALAEGGGILKGLGKFGGRAALLGGGLYLGSKLFGGGENNQQRLEDLTQQQKALVEPGNLVSMPQDDLKRFEALNNKFEKALDFLMNKQKETQKTTTGGGGGSSGGGGGQDMTSPSGSIDPGSVSPTGLTQTGNASFYGGPTDTYWQGRATASGEKFDENAMTAASNTIPLGSYARVTNPQNGKQVVVKINDTGGFGRLGRIMDLSYGAMKSLGGVESGVIPVQIEVVNLGRSSTVSAPSPAVRNTPATPRPVTSTIQSLATVPTRRSTPAAPRSATPTIVPIVIPQQKAPQQTSATSQGNDIVPSIDTTYPENFLALYSKLIYQIV